MAKVKERIGKKYGRLTVIEKMPHRPNTPIYYKCKCDCGGERTIKGGSLGTTKSCGCLQKEYNNKPRPHKIKKMIGKKFGYLKPIKLLPRKGKYYFYLCLCDCGKEKEVRGVNLRDGHTKSCGCFHDEQLMRMQINNIKHGLGGTRTYKAFVGAKERCKNNPYYEDVKFSLTLDGLIKEIGECPEGMELDRIDPYGDYCFGNIRWADDSLQTSNQRYKPEKNTTTGVRGVNKTEHGKYYASISHKNKKIHLGSFNNFWEAHQEFLQYYFILYNQYPNEFMA